MAENSTPDPAAAFREMMSRWEQGFNKLANDTMGSEAFSQSLHKLSGLPLAAQQQFGDIIGRYLTALNLPSRAEMVNIAERIQAMEAALVRIEAKLDQKRGTKAASAATPDSAARPPRTRKPPPVEGTP